jgi:hypothetical protein
MDRFKEAADAHKKLLERVKADPSYDRTLELERSSKKIGRNF